MNRRRHSAGKGFSLLEMVIALLIVSLLFGMAIRATSNVLQNEQLNGTARRLALMARTARQEALLENRPYELILTEERWTLQPAREEEAETSDTSSPPSGDSGKREEYVVPQSIKMKVRRWGSDDFEKIKEVAWYFSPTGLCAPNTFRLQKDEAWIQMTFNPLTANKQEEEWYLP